jgi:hypothetical protein
MWEQLHEGANAHPTAVGFQAEIQKVQRLGYHPGVLVVLEADGFAI